MLQSGVMTRDLDVRWVSSLSWYFLNLFGLQPVFAFLLGSDCTFLYLSLSFSFLVRTSLLTVDNQPPMQWHSNKWHR